MRRSGIRELMDLAAGRPQVLHLEVGEPDFSTPPHIVAAAIEAAQLGYTKYTPNKGLPEVREVMAAKLAQFNGLSVSPEQIVITTGAVTALMESLIALLDPGDAAFLPDPGWPNYEMMAATVGARIIRYPLDPADGFELDLERLEALINRTSGAKLVVMNSPANPTGAVFSPSTVQGLVELAQRAGLYVLSDECYEQIVFEGRHVSPATFDEDGRVISVFSLSKSYAMTGWRIGYLTASDEVTDLVAKVQEAVISCATAVAQKAAQAALDGDQSCVKHMRTAYRTRRDRIAGMLDQHGLLVGRPAGAFYVMADTSGATDDTYEFSRRLLIEHEVAVAPGETFGSRGKGTVRLSLAAEESVLAEGTRRFIQAVGGGLAGGATSVG
jgi:aspartate/methionine/tyrosine aminotransferase